MVFIAVGSLIVSVVALLGVYFTWQQVHLIKKERREEKERELEIVDWSQRASDVIRKLSTLMPMWHSSGRPGIPNGQIYTIIFPELDARQKIEQHLIRVNSQRNQAEARDLTPETMRLPVVRNTIQLVEERFANVVRENEELAKLARLT